MPGAATSTSLLSGFGITLPDWLTHGYRTALLSADPAVHGLLETAPRIAGIPILLNVPAALIVLAITAAALHRRARKRAGERGHGGRQARRPGAVRRRSARWHIDPANYRPFAPNGWTGIHQGAAIVFFAYIGFDAISTAAEETRDPQRNMPIGILARAARLHADLHRRRHRGDGARAVPSSCSAADPLARALELAGLPIAERDRRGRRRRVADRRAARISVRAAAHLLCDGARRPAAGVGVARASALSDAARHDAS